MSFTEAEWGDGVPFAEYLQGVEKHPDLWHGGYENAVVDDVTRARLLDLPGPRRVLILSEDWCGDAARSVPYLVRGCELAPDVEARVVDIANHSDLMNRHLSKGGRSIPVAIVADENGDSLGWWGPRPAPLQALLRARLLERGKPSSREEMGEFYAPIMSWYRKDAGKTILEELTLILERGGEAR